ncbi:MAG: alpha-glucosidase [Alphaproteobacteria bacterium]|nr:alpha-glucosidase [Alphaproteobacteria bacterium]
MNIFSKRPFPWWKGAFLYQIYPRSFLDTNNDGIGDLRGITEKLDYIASLGVDGIWISPFFKSPMKDFGYDVSDYRDVDPLFGSMKDFDALLKKAHASNLKIIIDLVLSHTSDQHPWFLESRKDKTNPKADWYVWSDKIPNNWVSVFGGPAWSFDEARGQYYFHNFLKEQPDLNFHNPEVQDAVLDIARFWLEKGVDGFRLDVANFYFHDEQLRDNPPRKNGTKFATQFEDSDPYSEQQHIYDKSRPENLAFMGRFRKLMDEYDDRMTVGEIGDDNPNERAAEYTAEGLLNTCYNTHMMSGTHKELTASLIREPIEKFLKQGSGWPSWAFSNHDVVRAASRWHSGGGFSHDPRLSKMLIALLGCLYGTVFLYEGEELGLPEARLKLEDLQDPWGRHLWPKWQGRDGCRTPIPWNSTTYAGFSSAKPWLPLPQSHHALNVAAQEEDKGSVLGFTRNFIQWRKTQAPLVHGSIEFINTGNEKTLAFRRKYKDENITCIFNLSGEENETHIAGEKIRLLPYLFMASKN